ncbi:MAG TPA: formylmethanofuran dehydrogenase subunit B [Methanocorpusculum sp.]|jgi:formylmethanofuran dehydrogenase subunit B|nr:formylmethanofuran dehydrogenase subunit B [Methanocorpusculum sp.]MBR5007987.1 formylmethanofuran dehydrogenase subunit B [Methanocorpusculum sp.]MBR5142655.1 formylmethanofuran dehydrogenase subunit B [Methanocorpusculum sp.]MBR5450784.1 formylmethanofuran dehydrogenase subunit B [Methanocorpusculum sp.]HJJ65964.1 formylmethanofuran dehydrogenase subunit B [Methanocorpusculum sp.]
MTKLVTDVICPFCGTLCDDLVVKLSDDGKQILEVENACAIGAEKFLHAQNPDRITRPRMKQENGEWKEVSYEEAAKYTAKILCDAKKPLMYGWSSTSCEAQSTGHMIAEKVGGIVDNTATVCHGPSLIAVHDVGIPSCTLGEVKNRADRIVFWGCNPAHAHPRHMSRYSIFPRGFFTVKGQKSRKIIVVDPRPTDTASLADIHVQVEQGRDYELLDALRVAFKGEELPDMIAGVPKEKVYELAELLKGGRFVTIFFGMGVTHSLGKNHNIDIAIAVTADLNKYTKASIIPMRGHYNVTGSGQVLGWQFGFPFCVDLSRGFARYNPGETSSNDLLQRGEVDACFVLGSDPGSHFPFKSVRKIYDLPSVCIDPHMTPTAAVSKCHVPVALVGVEVAGSCYRMDNVPIESRKVVDAPEGMLTDAEFLEMVLEEVNKIKGAAA